MKVLTLILFLFSICLTSEEEIDYGIEELKILPDCISHIPEHHPCLSSQKERLRIFSESFRCRHNISEVTCPDDGEPAYCLSLSLTEQLFILFQASWVNLERKCSYFRYLYLLDQNYYLSEAIQSSNAMTQELASQMNANQLAFKEHKSKLLALMENLRDIQFTQQLPFDVLPLLILLCSIFCVAQCLLYHYCSVSIVRKVLISASIYGITFLLYYFILERSLLKVLAREMIIEFALYLLISCGGIHWMIENGHLKFLVDAIHGDTADSLEELTTLKDKKEREISFAVYQLVQALQKFATVRETSDELQNLKPHSNIKESPEKFITQNNFHSANKEDLFSQVKAKCQEKDLDSLTGQQGCKGDLQDPLITTK